MAFDDLTPSQKRTILWLLDNINSGGYKDDFFLGRDDKGGTVLHLQSVGEGHGVELEDVSESAIEALVDEEYIKVAKGGRCTLRLKAYQEYKKQKDPLDLFSSVTELVSPRNSSIDIFVSHSSKDRTVAAALIELLRAALNVPSERIRCTSVDGYRLPAGASTDEQLRQEIYAAKVFIGLMTPTSFQSTYVLFELGARWGARLPLAPVLASGADASTLRRPLSGLNALSCDEPAQVHQLVDNIASILGANLSSAASYQRYVDALVQQSKTEKEPPQSEKAKTGSEVSIFTAVEENEFLHIYRKLNKNIHFSFSVFQKATNDAPVAKVGKDSYRVNLINVIRYYLNKGYRYFDYSILRNLLSGIFSEKAIGRDRLTAHQIYGVGRIEEVIDSELQTYGFTTLVRIQTSEGLENAFEFTGKMYRFKYWLEYNNLSVENLTFEFERRLEQ